MNEHDKTIFDYVEKMSDNAFNCSIKFTEKVADIIVAKFVVAFVLLVIWLLIITIKVF